jgi:tetratricopeptide (TPR) repeat protein
MAGWKVAQIDAIEELEDAGCWYRPVRLELGISAFGATTWSGHVPGDLVVNEHDAGDPTADQELFLVLRGRAIFDVDGQQIDAPAGTCLYVPPGVRRRAHAGEAATMVLLIEGTPGKGYEPRGWEIWAPLAPLYGAGRYAEVAQALRAAVTEHPQYGMLFFNLACCESLLGQTADALDHLRRAIALSDGFRENARSDEDLVALRTEPAFIDLVGPRVLPADSARN